MKVGTALDDEAKHRGTSVYLVDRRIDMIPIILSGNICSLRPNVDRLAFSVVWTFTPDGKIIDTDFFKSIIHSRRAFTYEQAQQVLDSNANDEIASSVRILHKFSILLNKERLKNGALKLESPVAKFKLDENKNPIELKPYTHFSTNKLVEEFMLLANCSVGKFILQSFHHLLVLDDILYQLKNVLKHYMQYLKSLM